MLIELFVWERSAWGIKKLLKFDRNELRFQFHWGILIPRKCLRKALFQHTVPPPLSTKSVIPGVGAVDKASVSLLKEYLGSVVFNSWHHINMKTFSLAFIIGVSVWTSFVEAAPQYDPYYDPYQTDPYYDPYQSYYNQPNEQYASPAQ